MRKTLTRRELLSGALSAGLVLAVPVLAAVTPRPTAQLRLLLWEDRGNGQQKAIFGPVTHPLPVGYAGPVTFPLFTSDRPMRIVELSVFGLQHDRDGVRSNRALLTRRLQRDPVNLARGDSFLLTCEVQVE